MINHVAESPGQGLVRLRTLLIAAIGALIIAVLPSATNVRAAGAANAAPASSGQCVQHGDQQGNNAGCNMHTRPGN